MSRSGWPSALVTALRDDDVEPFFLVEMQFDSGTERLHTGLGTITWDSRTWIGAGSFARVGVIEEGAELSPFAMEIGLSGVDQTILDIAMAESYFMRLVTIYLGAMDANAQVIDAGEFFFGYMMNMDVSLGDPDEGDSIMLTCESEAAVIERSPDLKYTDAQLQSEYPGDLGLEYVDQMVDAKPQWRGNSQVLPGTERGFGGGRGRRGGVVGERFDR